MTGRRIRLGFLYPGHSAEDDYPLIATMIAAPISVEMVHTSTGDDTLGEDVLRDNGNLRRLLDGAAELKLRNVDSAMWSCTSGSFLFGLEGAREQAKVVEEFLGVPTSSTALAFAVAAGELGLRRVAVASPYPDEIAQKFRQFMTESGFEVVHIAALKTTTAMEIAALGREQVLALAIASDQPGAEAVLLPDTALHTVAWLDDLEGAVGKPVLTANQVTMWQALRLAGHAVHQRSLGRLFATPVAAH